MTDEELKMQELKMVNRRLFAENVDLKVQVEELKQMVNSLETVIHLLRREDIR